MKRIGLLSIGQSPRPDLVQALVWPEDVVCIEAGALDGLARADLPAATGRFPLATRLLSGEQVVVDEEFLVDHLQAAVRRLESARVVAILLLCAGTFRGIESRMPLFKPFDLATAALHDWGIARLTVVCPFACQQAPMQARWTTAGFAANTLVASLAAVDETAVAATGAQCVVLDYVGHPGHEVAVLRAALSVPVVDVGSYAAATLASTLGAA